MTDRWKDNISPYVKIALESWPISNPETASLQEVFINDSFFINASKKNSNSKIYGYLMLHLILVSKTVYKISQIKQTIPSYLYSLQESQI